MSDSLNEKYKVLKEYFGYSEFRKGQEEIVDNLYSERDVVCIMPTGAGKSLCYQIPAIMFSGITIVVSPLISLMQDQVRALIQSGIPAAYINSSLTFAQYNTVLDRMANYRYKIVYAAPERLVLDRFIDICKGLNISMVVVDEAHCVSQWGQDFRPSYLKIPEFIEALPKRPVVGAFTATATIEVKNDIVKMLCLRNPFEITTGFDRPNLYFSVIQPDSKTLKLLSLLRERKSLCGIIYCTTRHHVEKVCSIINESGIGIPVTKYHAGLSEVERKRNQEDFAYDRVSVMVATNAFGMGIDKSNISYVIHYDIPKNLEGYYQEAGRAGRDGSMAECILLYSPHDVDTIGYFIERIDDRDLSEKEKKLRKEHEYLLLKYMNIYCTTKDCLRAYILRYFGEKAPNYCGKCSNCISKFETVDITTDAQKIMSCIVRTRQMHGVKMICDILRGIKDERLAELGFDTLSTYGIMKEYSDSMVRSVINALIVKEYLIITEGDAPVLRLGSKAAAVLRGEERVETGILKEDQLNPLDGGSAAARENRLYERLKSLRGTLAARASVPSYVIFTDAALKDMSRKKPKTMSEFSLVSGVSRAKLDKYGEAFIEAINDFEKAEE